MDPGLASNLGSWAVAITGVMQRFGLIAFLIVAAALLVGGIVRGEAGLLKFFTHMGSASFALVLLISVVAVAVMLIKIIPGAPTNVFAQPATTQVQPVAPAAPAGAGLSLPGA